MSTLDNVRKLADKFNKTYAKAPLLATGGDGRMTSEAVNTGAIARAQGQQRVIPRTVGHMPLSELIKRSKQT